MIKRRININGKVTIFPRDKAYKYGDENTIKNTIVALIFLDDLTIEKIHADIIDKTIKLYSVKDKIKLLSYGILLIGSDAEDFATYAKGNMTIRAKGG